MATLPIDLDSFSEPVRRLWDRMNHCTLCPRQCKVERGSGKVGFCGIGDMPIVSSVGPHFGEESVLVGPGGSGTIFFAGCSLGCVFCQNFDISHLRHGRPVTIEQLAGAMLELQHYACSNINLVTPTHLAAPIAAAIEMARKDGLQIPIVHNTGGYDSVETLKLLDGFVDIYMPDMKYSDPDIADELSAAPDYPQVNRAAVKEMHRQVGDLQIEKGFSTESAETAEKKQKIISAYTAVSAVKVKGLAKRGLLIRHLVLPENLAGSFEIIDFLTDEISPSTTINLMAQYRPCYNASAHPKINRRPTQKEIASARKYALEKGLNVLP